MKRQNESQDGIKNEIRIKTHQLFFFQRKLKCFVIYRNYGTGHVAVSGQ